jgi:hypothetical protein
VKTTAALVGLACIFVVPAAAGAHGDGPILSLEGAPDAPAAGDVYWADYEPPVTLDEPGVPDIQNDGGGVLRDRKTGRLLGSDESPWGVLHGPIERDLFDRVLPVISREHLGSALARIGGDAAATRGAARVVFWGLWRLFPPEALEAALPLLAMNALSSPRAENRRRAIRGLSEIGSPAAVDALLAFLYVGFAPRPLPTGEKEDCGVWMAGIDTDCGRLIGEEAYAALCLARLGATEALPAIEARLETTSGENARALADAVEFLRRCR